MLTFSDTVDANTIFYQPNDFIGYAHVQGMYPIGQYAQKWTKYSLLFFATVFKRAALTRGFDYGNKFRRDIATTLTVKLPITRTGEPNWMYMESYMKTLHLKTKQCITALAT